MIKKAAVSMSALVLCLSMFIAVSVNAQPAAGMAMQTGVSEHHQRVADMMKNMSQEMGNMAGQMARDEGGRVAKAAGSNA